MYLSYEYHYLSSLVISIHMKYILSFPHIQSVFVKELHFKNFLHHIFFDFDILLSLTKSDWSYFLKSNMEKLYTVSENKTWSWLWLSSWAAYSKIQAEIEESRETTRL